MLDTELKYSSPGKLRSQLSKRFEESLIKSLEKGIYNLAEHNNNHNFLFNLIPYKQEEEDNKLSFTDKILYGNFVDGIFGNLNSPKIKNS